MSWHSLICSAFRRLRQENNKFVAILGYMMRSWIFWGEGLLVLKKKREEMETKKKLREKNHMNCYTVKNKSNSPLKEGCGDMN